MILTDKDKISLEQSCSLLRAVLAAHVGHEQDRGFYLLSRAHGYVSSVVDSVRATQARAAAPGVEKVLGPDDLRTSMKSGRD